MIPILLNLLEVARVDKTVEDDGEAQTCDNFDNMGLKDDLLRGVYGYGFERPSVIQQRAIVPLLKGLFYSLARVFMTIGRDLIAQAQSGTGKTGAFTIGTLQQIDQNNPECQVLLLAPTRELAEQTFCVSSL